MIKDLEDLEGVGNAIAKKLKEADITLDDIAKFNRENDTSKLIEMGITESHAKKILANFTKTPENENDLNNKLVDEKVEDNDNIIISSKDPAFIEFAKNTKGYELK